MSSQQQPRPWFRLASIMRPAGPAQAPPPPPPARPPAPTPAPQPPQLQPRPPISPFRPPVALARPQAPAVAFPPPPVAAAATAPPSPVAPAPLSLPVVPPGSATPTTPKTPEITGSSPPAAFSTMSPVASPPPRSPVITGVPPPAASITRSPVAAPAPASPSPSPTIPKPETPIVKNSSSTPPASPGQKASSAETSATRPVVSSSSIPPSPKTYIPAPSSPLPTFPAQKTVVSSQLAPNATPIITNHVTAHAASPVLPPPPPVSTVAPIATVRAPASSQHISPSKVVKSWEKTPPPPESPILKHLSHPPSPLTLPPPQLKAGTDYLEPIPAEAEQKTVLMHDTHGEKPKTTGVKMSSGHRHHNNHGESHYNRVNQDEERELKKDKGMMHKKTPDSSPEFGMRIVTLAGENKGAVMELSPASRNKYPTFGQNLQGLQEKGSSRIWKNNGQKLGSNINDEGRSKMKDENDDKVTKMQASPMDAFVNSNVQGVNNSILYNCNYKNGDPGVHLSVSRKGNGLRGPHRFQESGHHD